MGQFGCSCRLEEGCDCQARQNRRFRYVWKLAEDHFDVCDAMVFRKSYDRSKPALGKEGTQSEEQIFVIRTRQEHCGASN